MNSVQWPVRYAYIYINPKIARTMHSRRACIVLAKKHNLSWVLLTRLRTRKLTSHETAIFDCGKTRFRETNDSPDVPVNLLSWISWRNVFFSLSRCWSVLKLAIIFMQNYWKWSLMIKANIWMKSLFDFIIRLIAFLCFELKRACDLDFYFWWSWRVWLIRTELANICTRAPNLDTESDSESAQSIVISCKTQGEKWTGPWVNLLWPHWKRG